MTQPRYGFDVDELETRLRDDVLPAWDLGEVRLELISVSENLAFRIHRCTPDESYVLRIHRPGYHTLAELVSEQLWTGALREKGVEVPIPVRTSDNRSYVSAAISAWDQPRQVGLSYWMEGRRLIDHDRDDLVQRYRKLGEIMAAMHNQATSWKPPNEFTRHSFDADGLMGEAPFWGRFWEHPGLSDQQRKLLRRVRQELHDRLSRMPKSTGGYSMIHADLHQGNVLVDGDQLRVIDFDDAGFGFHLYDLAVALFYLRDRDDIDAIRDSMLAGYQSVRTPRFSIQELPTFFLVRALASLGWIAARPEIDQSRVPQMIDDCCAMGDAFLKK